ncbi:DUF2516 family protein [Nocardioides sp.]|uniref:DUF2516 family protein n=1 Tax=Nocardioides sp. TaxID=35761 RepID=UPI003563EC3A
MLNVFAIESYILLVVAMALLAVKIFAFVNCLLWSAESYPVAGKLTKPAWAAILGLGVVVHLVFVSASPINLLNLVFTIAAFVYLADVRPALAGLRRR